MKKIYIILGGVIILISSILFTYNKNNKVNYINYNSLKLAMSVDGQNMSTLPSGNYFLVRYECTNGTVLSWDNTTSTLTSENSNVNDTCYLEFESSPDLYDLVNVGDYISYTGDNGCSGNQCKGWNAEQTNTDNYANYGFCSDSEMQHKFYTYGWRVLYKNDNSVFIVSAGAPECIVSTQNDSEATKNSLNEASLKYCNIKYISRGNCEEENAPIHAFNGDDFYKFTSQYYGNSNARYLYSYNDGGIFGSPYCYGKRDNCGFNDTIIDNGSYYWFASSTNSQRTIYWNVTARNISGTGEAIIKGVRPVIKLDSTVKATGGLGTMENPYTISERVTE